MNTKLSKLFIIYILSFVTIISCLTRNQKSENNNINLVKEFISARNTYNLEKIDSLITDGYYEKFIDGSFEVKSEKDLKNNIEFGKELNSSIKLLEISSKNNNIITIEEYANYIDTVLNRKKRTFKITYSISNNKIDYQLIDTLNGYSDVINYNNIQYQNLERYFNNIEYKKPLTKEFGIQLKQILDQYNQDYKTTK